MSADMLLFFCHLLSSVCDVLLCQLLSAGLESLAAADPRLGVPATRLAGKAVSYWLACRKRLPVRDGLQESATSAAATMPRWHVTPC
jgi:hypothetical protein